MSKSENSYFTNILLPREGFQKTEATKRFFSLLTCFRFYNTDNTVESRFGKRTLESRIIVHARNMYFDEISTMHGLIRDMHEPKFSTFELFWGIFAMFCPFCHVFL